MTPLRDRILCILCPAITSGRLPYNVAAEGWAVFKDTAGVWRAACPEHVDPAAWATTREIITERRER